VRARAFVSVCVCVCVCVRAYACVHIASYELLSVAQRIVSINYRRDCMLLSWAHFRS